MKTDIDNLKETFWLGYDTYYDSRVEADEVWNMYHNRQWSQNELSTLEKRGQPKETFNVIKLFGRLLIGYYSTVLNNVRALPTQESDATNASIVTDTIHAIFERNNMEVEGDKIKLSGIVSGLMCASIEPYKTGKRDKFGRPIYDIRIAHVPEFELVLDPMSTKEDYSDARFLHRFKWVTEDVIEEVWGEAAKNKLTAHYNYLNVDEADYEYRHKGDYYGRYRMFDNFLITHTVIQDNDGKRWSIFWCGDVELQRDEITYRDVKWNYRVTKLHSSDVTEYYGIFREVVETQKAINQALIKLQLMVNTQKAFVEKNAVDDLDEFTNAFNRVTGVVQVNKLTGLKITDLSRDALEQYQVIDKAMDRIQRILSINDSFLGMAFASDSGRKVKLQQNATIMALRYLTVRIQSFYELLGSDTASLIQQFFTANQVLRVSDEVVGQRFIELNKPIMEWTGKFDEQGQPIREPIFEQVFNPENGEPEETEDGQLVFAPIPEDGTELTYTTLDISIESVAFNDEDERSQLMVENVLAGNIGQMLGQVNPACFFRAAGLTLKSMKTRYSPEISKILEETAAMLSQDVKQEEGAAQMAGDMQNQSAPKSSALKLPTNTNEGQ